MKALLVAGTCLMLAAACSGGGGSQGECPQCTGIRDECIPLGMCTLEGGPWGSPGSTDCWENGVSQTHSVGATGESVTTTTLNGGACHTVETRPSASGFTSTFKNPSGQAVSTMTFNFATQSFTIECDGKTFVVGPGSTCPSYLPDGANCQTGTCSP